MSYMGIYKITNTVNGKVYIGQSVRLSERLNKHCNALKNNYHPNQHLQNAYNKYGDVFQIEIIVYCDSEEELDDLERYYISYYDSMNPQRGYNKEDGGSLNKHLSEETRKKMSKNHPDMNGANNPMYGKMHSAETRKKISEAMSGENHPMYGKTHSVETRKKISESLKGKKHSEKTRKKISKARKGKKLSEKTKKKMSEAKSQAMNKTGFYRVHKQKENNYKQGFTWCYRYPNKSTRKSIRNVNLLKLKEKVEAQGLPWEIIDEEKAQKSLELNNKYHKGEKND